MNREIKFRGLQINTKQWVYGYYVQDPIGRDRIYLKPFDEASSNTYFFVYGESVGQFTGIKDQNGKDIYEGDLVSHINTDQTCIIVFEEQTAMFLSREIRDEEMGFGIDDAISVIGNIHENVELLSDGRLPSNT